MVRVLDSEYLTVGYQQLLINWLIEILYLHCGLFVPVSVPASAAIASIVRSSLGPVGLDKMLVDDIGVRQLSYSIIRTMALMV